MSGTGRGTRSREPAENPAEGQVLSDDEGKEDEKADEVPTASGDIDMSQLLDLARQSLGNQLAPKETIPLDTEGLRLSAGKGGLNLITVHLLNKLWNHHVQYASALGDKVATKLIH